MSGSFAAAAQIEEDVTPALQHQCKPTSPDQLGPMYKPGAPVRSSVGKGFVLAGQVKSASDCAPVPGAEIELWLVAPSGEYDDDHRAKVIVGRSGDYRFESNPPVPYVGRPAHIHIRVSAPGFATLVTQFYPHKGQTQGVFDLVLAPSGS